MMQEPPQLLKHRLFYQGRKFSFEVNRYRLPNQVEGDWECVRHPGGALAVPITPEGKLILLRQYRFATQGRILEFPAGTVDQMKHLLKQFKEKLRKRQAIALKNGKNWDNSFLPLVILMKLFIVFWRKI